MSDKAKILITSYKNQNLDGSACAFAYAEFLRQQGKRAQAAVFGIPHLEAQFVFTKFKIPPLKNAGKFVSEADEIIIVDASDLGRLADKIQPEKVIEVIDHRKMHRADQFPRARIQIELVGAAAILIAEKFYSSRVAISTESAALLFLAIVSNTINF